MSNIAVIGGGPAGSTCAALLSRAGYNVTLYEKARFPRYHIGESLAPAAMAILRLSGALPAIEKAGFLVKRGGLLRWGGEDFAIHWEHVFGKGLHSWQVERELFDKVLLDHAQESGVTVHEGTTVHQVRMIDDRPVGVQWRNDAGDAGYDACDFIVDASGRAGVMGKWTGAKREDHEVFRNVAIWGYWTGATLLPDTPEGGLDAVSCPQGWYWTIPLRNDRYSIGFVTHRDHFRERIAQHGSREDLLQAYIAENDDMREIVRGATYVGPTRVEQDYSYVTERFSGPGYIMIGDAACFLDPLLSSGTHLGLYSALLGAASVAAAVDGRILEEEALGFFERRYRYVYERYLSMVSLMYQQYRGKETYFWHAQRLLKDGDRRQIAQASFTKLISGMADLRDVGYVNNDGRTFTTPQIPISAVSDPQGSSGLRLVLDPKLGLASV
ncbi:MAG: NAD(P)-binding protein [Corynebacteriales bacterium]|nr:NAD(P)-binding protein [Mycobacteriales bacterium]